ncbi:MAG: hypothetical protein H7249_05275 [Chitinophagaceae bacterium]|nr:hypothetical protein [Oligoflexus sp.]
MLSTSHEDLKAQIVTQCRELFPEVKSIVFWGGSVVPGFSKAINDVDVILEIDSEFKQEVVLAERLKTLIQTTSICRLDPFIYLTGSSESEPLELIAPFGFYKANAFIPYLIQKQHEIAYGKSRLLNRLAPVTLNEALVGFHPQVMGALKRLRMDAQVEPTWAPLLSKHKSYFFMITRTYFAFEHAGVGTKQESLSYLAQKFPRYQNLVEHLDAALEGKQAPGDEPGSELILDFVRDMEGVMLGAIRQATTH